MACPKELVLLMYAIVACYMVAAVERGCKSLSGKLQLFHHSLHERLWYTPLVLQVFVCILIALCIVSAEQSDYGMGKSEVF